MLPFVKPEEVGFSSRRLERIAPMINKYIDERKLPGMIALVARRGKVAYFEKFGEMDSGKAMQFDAIFRIYSMSKPITSTAVMMLFEEGHFRLSDPVSRYIPWFKDPKVMMAKSNSDYSLVPAQREITIRDLLCHSAGLSYGFEPNSALDEMYRKKIWAQLDKHPELGLAGWIENAAKLPLAFHPGTSYRYSMATDVLGYLVQVVSGQPFEKFLKESIFDPLGMLDTAFYVAPEKVSRFTATYGPSKKGGLEIIDPSDSKDYLNPKRIPSGGGGLVSTTQDYLRFCQMMLNGGALDGVRLLGRKTVELMTIDHLAQGVYSSDDQGWGFGLGFGVLTRLANFKNLGSLGTYTWGGAANTKFIIDPKEELIYILMLQYMPGFELPVDIDFNNLVYQALVD